jgi:integrase/recombinase XerC
METGNTALVAREPAAVEIRKRLFARWLAGKSPRTVEAYRSDIQDFARYLGVANVDAAVETFFSHGNREANGTALDYVAEMKRRGLSSATVNRRLAALRSLAKLARMTVDGCTVALDVENEKREPRRDASGPGEELVREVLGDLRRSRRKKDIRDRSALFLMATVGLRRGEVLSLTVEDVEADAVTVLRKGHREKVRLEVPPEAGKAIARWLKVRGDAPGPVFPLTASALWKMVKARGLKRPHGLRHVAVTAAVEIADHAGLSRATVADFSGHRSVETVEHYNDRRDARARQGWYARAIEKRLAGAIA